VLLAPLSSEGEGGEWHCIVFKQHSSFAGKYAIIISAL